MVDQDFAQFDDSEVRAALKRLDKKFKMVEGAKREYAGFISAIVFQDVISHFNDQKGEDGPWPKWSDVYTKHMQATGKGGNRILQDYGRLRQSFQPSNFREASGGILWFNNAKTAQGFPYAYAHDEGGPKLPQRSFMWLSGQALEKVGEQTLKYLEED